MKTIRETIAEARKLIPKGTPIGHGLVEQSGPDIALELLADALDVLAAQVQELARVELILVEEVERMRGKPIEQLYNHGDEHPRAK